MATKTEIVKPKIKIKVFGVGGGGNNAIARMQLADDLDLELVAVNSDAKQLSLVERPDLKVLQIGESLTGGRGTGGRVELGDQAARMEEARLRDAMTGADLLFITAAMGGGFGTGAAPVIARIAKEAGILTAGVVTEPFSFEGNRKKRLAEAGITRMQSQMDALIVVANDNLMKLPENRNMTLSAAFKAADAVLDQAISCIAELILKTGFINVDFADVTTIFRHSESSDALLGIGRSKRSAVDAVKAAVTSPLFSRSLKGTRAVILNLTGDSELSMYDVDEAIHYIADSTDDDVDLILGTVIDDTMEGEVQATIIAMDFSDSTVLKAPTVTLPEKKEPAPTPKINLDPPSFMTNKKGKDTQGAFAIPAFRLVEDPKGPERK